MIKINRVTLENENMKDDRERKDKELEATNKRTRESDERREKFGHALKGPNMCSRPRIKSWIKPYTRFKS